MLELRAGLSQPNRRTRVSMFLVAKIVLVSDSSSWFALKMTKEYCYEHCRGQTVCGNFAQYHLLQPEHVFGKSVQLPVDLVHYHPH